LDIQQNFICMITVFTRKQQMFHANRVIRNKESTNDANDTNKK